MANQWKLHKNASYLIWFGIGSRMNAAGIGINIYMAHSCRVQKESRHPVVSQKFSITTFELCCAQTLFWIIL